MPVESEISFTAFNFNLKESSFGATFCFAKLAVERSETCFLSRKNRKQPPTQS